MLRAINDCGIVQHQFLQPLYFFACGSAHQHALASPWHLQPNHLSLTIGVAMLDLMEVCGVDFHIKAVTRFSPTCIDNCQGSAKNSACHQRLAGPHCLETVGSPRGGLLIEARAQDLQGAARLV